MFRHQLTPLLAMLIATPAAHAQAPAAVVRAAEIQREEVQQHHRVTGSLRAVARGDVAALEEGRVVEITVREGAMVRQGDVVARIDPRRLQARRDELAATLDAAKALVDQRQLELRQAQRDLKRSHRLLQGNATAVELHEHRETSAAVAEAQLVTDKTRVAEIESQLTLLDVRLEDTEIHAPYDGQVVERHAEPGEWIRAGEPFVTLVSAGQIEAWLDVPERFAQTLGIDGLRVDVEGFPQTLLSDSVKRVPDVHLRTRTFPLVLTLDDQDGRLAAGMSVEAWLPVGEHKPRLTAPKDAIIRNGRSAYVYKAVEQQGQTVAVQSAVTIAFEMGERVALSAGELDAGDQVIVEGNERVVPGSPISVAQQASARSQYANSDR